jgi:hypothetical protein
LVYSLIQLFPFFLELTIFFLEGLELSFLPISRFLRGSTISHYPFICPRFFFLFRARFPFCLFGGGFDGAGHGG